MISSANAADPSWLTWGSCCLQQEALIEHLQEQHYQQYMQQVYQQQILHQQQQFEQLQKLQKEQPDGNDSNTAAVAASSPPVPIANGVNGAGDRSTPEGGEGASGEEGMCKIGFLKVPSTIIYFNALRVCKFVQNGKMFALEMCVTFLESIQFSSLQGVIKEVWIDLVYFSMKDCELRSKSVKSVPSLPR